jgi:hypothetical protein
LDAPKVSGFSTALLKDAAPIFVRLTQILLICGFWRQRLQFRGGFPTDSETGSPAPVHIGEYLTGLSC